MLALRAGGRMLTGPTPPCVQCNGTGRFFPDDNSIRKGGSPCKSCNGTGGAPKPQPAGELRRARSQLVDALSLIEIGELDAIGIALRLNREQVTIMLAAIDATSGDAADRAIRDRYRARVHALERALADLCDSASTEDLPRGLRDLAHRSRLVLQAPAWNQPTKPPHWPADKLAGDVAKYTTLKEAE